MRCAGLQEDQFQALIRLFGKLHVKGGRDKDGNFFEYVRLASHVARCCVCLLPCLAGMAV
jgi:hypothetical protein